MATTPEARRQAIVRAVVDARQTDGAVTFLARGTDGDEVAVEYRDRSLRLELEDAGRDRLEDLLSEYHVFKVEQPATRRADPGILYLSAVTDPKHLADFVDALFRDVHGLDAGYAMTVERA